MKFARTTLFVLSLFLLSGWSFSQTLEPLCGTSVLDDTTLLRRAWEKTLARHPDLQGEGRLFRRPSDGILPVGTLDTFWVFNFVSGSFDRTAAELRAAGPSSQIWVALDELQNLHVDSIVVSEILKALEDRTPPASRDSSKGILELEQEYFGDPPNINANFMKGQGDGRTDFLIYDIVDGWSGSGGYIAGYFFKVDVDPAIFPSSSNRRDLLYIDSFPGIFHNAERNPQAPLGTLAHEFQHLIHWNYDPDETSIFFNEGLSEYSSYVCGFGLRRPDGYFEQPNVVFLDWRGGDNTQVLADYSRAALWTLYLGEQYGPVFIKKFTQNPNNGVSGFGAALDSAGIPSNFASTVFNFHIANYVQNRQLNGRYGYIDSLAVRSRPKIFKNNFGSLAQGGRAGLSTMAVDYIRFFAAETLQTTFTLGTGSSWIKSLAYTDLQTTIGDVQPGVTYQTTFGASTRSELIFVVHNNSLSGSLSYSYTGSGVSRTSTVLELKNDDGSLRDPYRLFQPGDTAFVVFDAIEGGRVDSVALWFESTGSARIFIRDANMAYDLNRSLISGLGGRPRMAGGPVSFAVTDTGFLRTVVDLRPYNVYSSPEFVVQVIYQQGMAPNPFLRRDTSQSTTRSYLSLSQQPTPGRTMYASLGDFYVRPYLSHAGFLPPPSLPEKYTLYQNYPNPFNPSTMIAYDLPQSGKVRLEVFDLLGRKVAVLVDEFQEAGSPARVVFDASFFSAGVYFYRLSAGTFSETKKMVVVR